jgi:hypothetical protein
LYFISEGSSSFFIISECFLSFFSDFAMFIFLSSWVVVSSSPLASIFRVWHISRIHPCVRFILQCSYFAFTSLPTVHRCFIAN